MRLCRCGKRFVPKKITARYCSRRCAKVGLYRDLNFTPSERSK